MNEFLKIEILHCMKELEDQLTVTRLLALRKLKNDDIAGAYDMLTDGIKAIDVIRDMFP